ncbi:thiamine-binding periplasmic protein, partial [mine drainage metagenome]
IYGIGIVAGTHHLALDQAFENWFLGGTVQELIPETEWEYPANSTVTLPAVYAAAPDPSTIVPLNNDTSPAQVAADLPGWITTWLGLATGAG